MSAHRKEATDHKSIEGPLLALRYGPRPVRNRILPGLRVATAMAQAHLVWKSDDRANPSGRLAINELLACIPIKDISIAHESLGNNTTSLFNGAPILTLALITAALTGLLLVP